MKKAVQYFTPESLAYGASLSPQEVLEFLENFRALHAQAAPVGKSRLISLKVPQPLLDAFRVKAAQEGVPYQTQIKRLMEAWLKG